MLRVYEPMIWRGGTGRDYIQCASRLCNKQSIVHSTRRGTNICSAKRNDLWHRSKPAASAFSPGFHFADRLSNTGFDIAKQLFACRACSTSDELGRQEKVFLDIVTYRNHIIRGTYRNQSSNECFVRKIWTEVGLM
jgi:hypothetical protein